MVVFLELFQVFLDLVERRVEAVLLGLELLRILQPKLGLLRQLLLFLGQPLEVVDGLVHFGLPLQLAELFKGPVELLFHGVVVELHLIQLLLQLLRVHLLHELLHLLKQLAHFFAHQVVHQLLELLLLVQHALLLLGKFVGAFVFLGVVALHLLQLFLKRLLLFQQVLHGLAVLPGHLALLAKPFLHGLHGLPQFCGLLGGVLQVFFDGFCGVDALFPQVSRGGRFQPRGGGPHLLGPMHSVVVPNLKPSLQHIAFSPIQFTQVPHVVERSASALRNLKLDTPIGQGGGLASGRQQLFRRPISALHNLPNKRQPAEPVVVLDRAGEVHLLSGGAVLRLLDSDGGLAVADHPDAVTKRVARQGVVDGRDPIRAVGGGHSVGGKRVARGSGGSQPLVVPSEPEGVRVVDLHGPLDGRAFGHRHIALVLGVHLGQARVGRGRRLQAQVGQHRHGERFHGVVHRPPAVGQKLKVNVVPHGREGVPEHMGFHAFHPEAAVAGLQGHRGGQFVALGLHGDHKGVPRRDLHPVVQQHKFKRGRLDELGPVLHDAGGGGGHPIGLHPQAGHHQCGDGRGPPQHPDGARHVHSACERQWPKGRGALVDARRQQRDVGTLGVVDLALKLKGVQELVLDLRKVVAHDAGSFVVAQPLAEAGPLC